MQGGIHWGPLPQFDSWWRTFGIRQDRVKGYHSDFHKYTLEWDERYMTICEWPSCSCYCSYSRACSCSCACSRSCSQDMTDGSRPPPDIDNRVYSTLDISFDRSFWSRGNFPTYFVNGTDTVKLANPWVQSTSNAAPFDERELTDPLEGQASAEIAENLFPTAAFYLILNVAVGGTNGFFPDNVGGKPWSDSSLTAMGGESPQWGREPFAVWAPYS